MTLRQTHVSSNSPLNCLPVWPTGSAVPGVIVLVAASPLMPAAAIVPVAPKTHIADAQQIEPCLANGIAARAEPMEHMAQVLFGAIHVLAAPLSMLSLRRRACHRSDEDKHRYAPQERFHVKVPPNPRTATPCKG